jgi:hypothetical protein
MCGLMCGPMEWERSLQLENEEKVEGRDQEWTSLQANPHLWQLSTSLIPLKSFTMLPRKLVAESPRLPYRRRRGEMKSVVHWGQRKLLISEIEFLTQYSRCEKRICVYCGAAPGNHIPYLAELFPQISFILIDPLPFACEETDQIMIRNELMTDQIAQEYQSRSSTSPPVLFLSDIRSADWRVYGNQLLDTEIARDMSDQMRWHDIIAPLASLLKFRLPWTVGSTQFLRGEVSLPLWGPQTTTESRLVVEGHERCEWDHQRYWEQMFYFNTVTRCTAYDHPIPPLLRVGRIAIPTLPPLELLQREDHEMKDDSTAFSSCCVDSCYDCSGEILVLQEYLRMRCEDHLATSAEGKAMEDVILGNGLRVKIGSDRMNEVILQMIDQISEACSQLAQAKRHLEPESEQTKRRKRSDQRGLSSHETDHGLISSCPTTVHSLDLLRSCCPSSPSFSWLGMSPPDMSDLPHDDRGERGLLGIGHNIPPDCALDIWLWRLLESVVGPAEPQKTIDPLVSSTLESLCLDVESKLRILQQVPLFQDSPKEDLQGVPVVTLFTESGVAYFYHRVPGVDLLSSVITCSKITLPPFNWPSSLPLISQVPALISSSSSQSLPVLFCGQYNSSNRTLSLTHLLCYRGVIPQHTPLDGLLQTSLLSAFDFGADSWKLSVLCLSGLQKITPEDQSLKGRGEGSDVTR